MPTVIESGAPPSLNNRSRVIFLDAFAMGAGLGAQFMRTLKMLALQECL